MALAQADLVKGGGLDHWLRVVSVRSSSAPASRPHPTTSATRIATSLVSLIGAPCLHQSYIGGSFAGTGAIAAVSQTLEQGLRLADFRHFRRGREAFQRSR